MPTVSVIIPAYNTAQFIAEALDSVFAQTFDDFEVIVINDGSPDTAELERAVAPYSTRILYLRQDNRGPAGARNTGLRHALGKYAAFLDSDDSWLPDYLASQMKVFETNSSLSAVYFDAYFFGDPAVAGKTYMQVFSSNGRVTLESVINEDCQIITSCTVVLRQAILDAGLFDERVDLRGCEDYDLWLRILYRGGHFAFDRTVLGRYRSHPASLSKSPMKMSLAQAAVYEKTETTMNLSDQTRTILRKKLGEARAQADLEAGRNFLTAGDFDRAKDSLMKANRFFQRAKLRITILGLKLAPRPTRLAVMKWQKLIVGRRQDSAPNASL
jgi:glycosyltransferase involved in cell wall biosynthesis